MVTVPTTPQMPNDISIGPAVFAGYLVVTFQTDRQTDRSTDHGNVSSNRLHLYATHIRCGLKIQFMRLIADLLHDKSTTNRTNMGLLGPYIQAVRIQQIFRISMLITVCAHNTQANNDSRHCRPSILTANWPDGSKTQSQENSRVAFVQCRQIAFETFLPKKRRK